MKTSKIRIFLVFLLMFPVMGIIFSESNPVNAQSVNLRLDKIVWGTDFNSPGTVEPGTEDTALSISITNLSNYTLSGIQGVLNLSYPFSDYGTGGYNTTDQGETLDDSFQRDVSIFHVLPGESLFFEFSISIDIDGDIGQYSADLEVSYLYNDTITLKTGTPVNYEINLIIANRAPSIDSSYPSETSLTIEENETIDFSIAKVSDPDNQQLTYKWILDNLDFPGATTNNFTFQGNSSNLGIHTLEAQIRDPENLTASVTWDIDVVKLSETNLTLVTQEIFAGYKSDLSFSVSNTLWKGTADVSLTIPEEFIAYGDITWTLTNLTPGETVMLSASLYAPIDLLGTTGSVTVDIVYTDYLGDSQSESVSQGIIIRGKIEMIVYDLTAQYNSATGRVSFSASLLNKGTLSAMFVNISLKSNPDLTPTLDSSSYIGELEQNDPVSFTVGAELLDGVKLPITVVAELSWTDDLQVDLSKDIAFTLLLSTTTTTQGTPGTIDPGTAIGGGFVLVVIAGTVIGAMMIIRRRRK
ncbi:MAG: COG1361 S-layer family protein [Candidatus Hodarchaeales archaeon]|jgi:hypothetical protein